MKLFAFQFSDVLTVVRAADAEGAAGLVRIKYVRPSVTAAEATELPTEGPAEVVTDFSC